MDWLTTSYRIEHTLVLKRSDLLKSYKDLPINDIEIYHFKDRPVYHNGKLDECKLIHVFNTADLVLFVDKDQTVKVLKTRFANFNKNILSKWLVKKNMEGGDF